jgi:muramoyltetrapeptide carboxypeptidase LdcA involved in peptidoglycan recycling
MTRDELYMALEKLTRLSQIDIQKEINEGREKARRDERANMQGMLEFGIQQGREEGVLMGQIEILQSLLGQEIIPRSEMQALSLESLQQKVGNLRRQMER